jgi:hypothetical protein
MLRIELAAQLADATAEVEALAADGAVEQPAATASPDAASPDAASPAAGRPANAVEADSPPAQSPG